MKPISENNLVKAIVTNNITSALNKTPLTLLNKLNVVLRLFGPCRQNLVTEGLDYFFEQQYLAHLCDA